MASGLETLDSIDRAVDQVRRDIQDLDRAIQIASDELVRVGQEETKHFRDLAKMRLDQLANGELLSSFDGADRRITELLHERSRSVEALQGEIDELHRRQSQLEADRAAQQKQVHSASEAVDRAEAATQTRLASDRAYQEQLEKTRAADSVAKQAEKKFQQAQQDRSERGKPYESDTLFMYLWNRGYGTADYSANFLTRALDAWVARLCRFDEAGANYAIVVGIPKRMNEHAENVKAEANRQLDALRQLEVQAAATDGVPPLRETLAREEKRAGEIDAAIREAETRYGELLKTRSEYAGGEDQYSRQCLQVLVDQLHREPLPQLRREAEQTSSPEDNLLVQNLTDLDQNRGRLKSHLAQHKELHLRHLARLEELEKVRWNFKSRRYDDVHSTFPNGVMVGAMLNEFLRGMANSGQLWNTIENTHRRRRIESDPDFGSGGFGRSSGGTWHVPMPAPRDSGSGSMGGGSFRTGGGF